MKIVVTGFEAFHTNSENPSQEVVRLLPKTIQGHQIISLELPVLYDECFDLVETVILQEQPIRQPQSFEITFTCPHYTQEESMA